MDFEGLKKPMRRANIAVLIVAPILFAGVFLLKNAGEAVLHGLEIACFFGVLGIFAILQTRAERRDERRDQ
jgi:hypothetical protein